MEHAATSTARGLYLGSEFFIKAKQEEENGRVCS